MQESAGVHPGILTLMKQCRSLHCRRSSWHLDSDEAMLESAGVHPGILTLMKQCWAEEPSERPSFDDVIKALKNINKGKSVLLLHLKFQQHFAKKEHSESAYLSQGKSSPDPVSESEFYFQNSMETSLWIHIQ